MKNKIIINIFSNWAYIVIAMLTAFIVSPIMVKSLGNEKYGIWTIIVSITGYFTIMDFGVQTAIVKYISKYKAVKDIDKIRTVYSSAFFFFTIVSFIVLVCVSFFAFFFTDIFEITIISKSYANTVFMVAGLSLISELLFSIFSATLHGLQEFLKLNIVNIFTIILKNSILVLLLINGYDLLTVAILSLALSLLRAGLKGFLIRKFHKYIKLRLVFINRTMMGVIFNYSVYSFLIALALKLLFFTDSIVIGKLVSLEAVTFYAIPMTLMVYLEQMTTAGMTVLTPVVSGNDVLGNHDLNKHIYIIGSKYSLMLSLPILFVLFTNGDSFITLWIGSEYGEKSKTIIQILCIGYAFYLSQIIAVEVLKGINRHKVFAYILICEAILNLGLSIILVRKYGIEGVALGTAVPLIFANLFIIPFYVCYVLKISYIHYIYKGYFSLLGFTLILGLLYYRLFFVRVDSFFDLTIYSIAIAGLYLIFSFFFVLTDEHKTMILSKMKLM